MGVTCVWFASKEVSAVAVNKFETPLYSVAEASRYPRGQ